MPTGEGYPVGGVVRFYHGAVPGIDVARNSEVWLTPHLDYAADFRGKKDVWYVDIQINDPELEGHGQTEWDGGKFVTVPPYTTFKGSANLARKMRLLKTHSEIEKEREADDSLGSVANGMDDTLESSVGGVASESTGAAAEDLSSELGASGSGTVGDAVGSGPPAPLADGPGGSGGAEEEPSWHERVKRFAKRVSGKDVESTIPKEPVGGTGSPPERLPPPDGRTASGGDEPEPDRHTGKSESSDSSATEEAVPAITALTEAIKALYDAMKEKTDRDKKKDADADKEKKARESEESERRKRETDPSTGGMLDEAAFGEAPSTGLGRFAHRTRGIFGRTKDRLKRRGARRVPDRRSRTSDGGGSPSGPSGGPGGPAGAEGVPVAEGAVAGAETGAGAILGGAAIFAAAVFEFGKAAYSFARSQEAEVRRLSAYGAEQAQGIAQLDANRIARDVKTAAETGGSATDLTNSINSFEDKLRPIISLLENIGNSLASGILDVLGEILDLFQPLVDVVKAIYDFIVGEKLKKDVDVNFDILLRAEAKAAALGRPRWPLGGRGE